MFYQTNLEADVFSSLRALGDEWIEVKLVKELQSDCGRLALRNLLQNL